MTYAVNGTEFVIQPTTGRWIPQSAVGITGNGTPIYPSVRMFEIRWNLVTPEHANQIVGFFETIGFTGTANVRLPEYTSATYQFVYYSGCVLYQPEFGVYFAEHYQDIVMMVGMITT